MYNRHIPKIRGKVVGLAAGVKESFSRKSICPQRIYTSPISVCNRKNKMLAL